MRTKIVEAVQGPKGSNHGKFLVGQLNWEWQREVQIPGVREGMGLLTSQGWHSNHIFVLDLATGEGAFFYPNRSGSPSSDLNKTRIRVCPLFEPFLGWLYQRGPVISLEALPPYVELPEAPFEFHGYRRPGNQEGGEDPPASFTCPRCHMTSHHPGDIRFRYCGNCHDFFEESSSGVALP